MTAELSNELRLFKAKFVKKKKMKSLVFTLAIVVGLVSSCEKNYHNLYETTTLYLKTSNAITGQPVPEMKFSIYGQVYQAAQSNGTKGVTDSMGIYHDRFSTYSDRGYEITFEDYDLLFTPNYFPIQSGVNNTYELEVLTYGWAKFEVYCNDGIELNWIEILYLENPENFSTSYNDKGKTYTWFDIPCGESTENRMLFSGEWKVRYSIQNALNNTEVVDTIINVPDRDSIFIPLVF